MRTPEAVKQAAVADRIVLTKTDLADAKQRERIVARLRALNPAAPILDAAKGEATAEQLLACGLYDPERKIPDVKKWLAAEAYADAQNHELAHHHHHDRNRHDEHIGAFVLTADAAIPAGTLEMFLELLRATHGAKLLRLKGIVKLAEMPDTPVVVHGVQHVFHPTARLQRWPDDDHRTRLVFITRDLPERTVRELFEAFLGARRHRPAGPRGPDRQSAHPVRGRRPVERPAPLPLVPAKAGTQHYKRSVCYLALDSRLRGNERNLSALARHREPNDANRRPPAIAGKEPGGKGETSWNDPGCGIIRRACPPTSTLSRYPSLVAMFEESFQAHRQQGRLRLHGQDLDLCRARRRPRAPSPPGCRARACNAAPASPS